MKIKSIVLAASLLSLMAGPALSAPKATQQPAAQHQGHAAMNMFGGEVYIGEPALSVTVALIQAGGGADNFSFAKALVHMLGEDTVNAEVAKLVK